MKVCNGSWDYLPMATDNHKGQHFIHQPLHTPNHTPSCPFLYHSIRLPPNTTSSLLCSSSSDMKMAMQITTKMLMTAYSKQADKTGNAAAVQSQKAAN